MLSKVTLVVNEDASGVICWRGVIIATHFDQFYGSFSDISTAKTCLALCQALSTRRFRISQFFFS